MKVAMRLVWPGFDDSSWEAEDITVGYYDNCVDENWNVYLRFMSLHVSKIIGYKINMRKLYTCWIL
jgi:hypothetical protein